MTIDPEVKREIEDLKKRVSGLERKLRKRPTVEETWEYARESRKMFFFLDRQKRDMINHARDDISLLNHITDDLEKYIFDNMKRIEKLERFQRDVQRSLIPKLPFL